MKLLAVLSLSVTGLLAQQADMTTISGATKTMYRNVRNNIIRSAEKMPAEHYSFKPAPEVRSFGELLGHIGNASNRFCSAAAGETRQLENLEKTKTTKDDIVAAIKEVFAYCDKVHDGLTEASVVEKVKFGNSERPRVAILDFNTVHNMEHYGNIVTYMRIKGLVPPSSER